MAKRGKGKRSKSNIVTSALGPGRPDQCDAKRQRLRHSNSVIQGTECDGDSNHDIKVEIEMEPQDEHSRQQVLDQPITDLCISNSKNDESSCTSSSGNQSYLEDNGHVYKTFDTNYEMGDILMNGSTDSIIDMPLFHEVDSLMNIKHEDHLNDTVFYLPMSYSLDNTVKIEMGKNQVAEVTRTLANEFATPNAVLYVTPDQSKATTISHTKKECQSPTGNLSNAQVEISVKKESVNNAKWENSVVKLTSGLTNGQETTQKQENGFPPERNSGKTNKKIGKRSQNPSPARTKHSKKKNINRQTSQSSSSLSDCSSGEDNISSASLDNADLGPPQLMFADDPPEIDRFVICSDHSMECVLCAFTTDSYSAFKSHIICSHPCWRITKKLSKNRLLVERSVKSGASVFNTSDQTELRTTKSGTGYSSFHTKVDQELQKVLRKYEKNPRKRQLFERNKRLFKCTICLRLFVFEGSVVNHVTDQHGATRPYEKIHISNDHGQKFGPIFRCSQNNCYFSCESDGELDRHILDRHTQVMYRCQLCGFTEDSAEAVRSHGICMHQQQLACS